MRSGVEGILPKLRLLNVDNRTGRLPVLGPENERLDRLDPPGFDCHGLDRVLYDPRDCALARCKVIGERLSARGPPIQP